jgi:hypothetical protein
MPVGLQRYRSWTAGLAVRRPVARRVLYIGVAHIRLDSPRVLAIIRQLTPVS